MSELPSVWKIIIQMPEFSGYTFSTGPAPRTDVEKVIRFRTLCAENKCGCYGTTWGCPPGSCSDEETPHILERYSHTLIFYKRFENIDFQNFQQFITIQRDFQNICRKLSDLAREKNRPN